MKQKLICLLLAVMMILGVLTGCRAQNAPSDSAAANGSDAEQEETMTSPEQETKTDSSEEGSGVVLPTASPLGFTDFDSRLIAFLLDSGKTDENFAVSPLSFRAALALAGAGAEGETLNQLLAVMGFSSVEDMNAWYASVLDGTDEFATLTQPGFSEEKSQSAYRVVNSVWKNEDLPGEFREAYVREVAEKFRADASSAPAAQLANAVNAWVNEQTNGLIPKLLNNASDSSAVLVNALYLKTGWSEPFRAAGEADFTSADGSIGQKEYMEITGKYDYYEDDACQLVTVPLQGGITMIFVLGDAKNLPQKLSRAESARVHITVPKFDLETSLDDGELKQFLCSLGCTKLFSDAAEFAPMFTAPLCVDEIIQKSKVKIYEEGLEASAATGMIMKNTAVLNPEQPKEFRADHAFSFYITQGTETQELLFWGQIVR